ncbi:hypothetical protein [Mycolicibacter kumamotonensis]|uniref:Uncharacterized protein n=1 Tax=Mycolicibacter kumamotonensis TaxID=354243 RepID=A0A7K3LHI8_9MYCO|nr:hypothetical protein [Mycolicibacter kumamotonensis]NDJ91828.1 hypothetical protein [Mycolicibacter kumamotonensis]
MATSDAATEAEPAKKRESRGISHVGGDFRISDLTISIGDDGQPSMGAPRVEMRTEMWPFWLEEAIEAAALAAEIASNIPGTLAELEAGGDSAEAADERLRALAIRELRATMRAIAASAFAIDAFYASVKARSPEHPQQGTWKANGTARHKQVVETFRFHLRISNRDEVKRVKSIVRQLFQFRDWAVHPGAKYREPVYRPDLNASYDWHFTAFCRDNALAAVHEACILLDFLTDALDRGGEGLPGYKAFARPTMNTVLDLYESHDEFLPMARHEPSTQID